MDRNCKNGFCCQARHHLTAIKLKHLYGRLWTVHKTKIYKTSSSTDRITSDLQNLWTDCVNSKLNECRVFNAGTHSIGLAQHDKSKLSVADCWKSERVPQHCFRILLMTNLLQFQSLFCITKEKQRLYIYHEINLFCTAVSYVNDALWRWTDAPCR